jgi:predicted HAD superfamily Cof-like phosphohydrolase
MNKHTQLIKDFMELFDQKVLPDLSEPSDLATRQLRIKLIFEELTELAKAMDVQGTFLKLCEDFIKKADKNKGQWKGAAGYTNQLRDGNNNDIVETLDALIDLEYVTTGTVLSEGLQGVYEKNFDIVHVNNMTKAHRDLSHAIETAQKKSPNGGNAEELSKWRTVNKEPHGVLLFDPNNKVVKPHDHVKVKLDLDFGYSDEEFGKDLNFLVGKIAEEIKPKSEENGTAGDTTQS